MKTPTRYRRPKSLRFSFDAGYRAGYDGKPNRVEVRATDNHAAYNDGYTMGQQHRKQREKRRAVAEDGGL